MKSAPIQKLNKKLIYLCLLGAAAIAIPLAILPMASGSKKKKEANERQAVQAHVQAQDAFALSGVEKFPSSYEGVKDFENESLQAPKPSVDEVFNQAFDKLAKFDQEVPVPKQPHEPLSETHKKSKPWVEASEQEQKRRAFEYYASRRSDILFASKNNSGATKQNKSDNPMMGVLEKSLELAQRHMNPSINRNAGIFFPRNNGAQSTNDIGKIKNPADFMLSQGTLISAVLLNEINTDLPGPVMARVSHNIWDSKTGQTLLIPQNSMLLGIYKSGIGHGQTRAQVVWSRIIFPNQQSVNLGEMTGLDKQGVSGAGGSVNNHYDKVALSLFLTTTLGAGVRMTQGRYDSNSANVAQELGNSLAQETARMGSKIAEKMLAIPPTIKVPMGKRLNVFVQQDLNLQPYQG